MQTQEQVMEIVNRWPRPAGLIDSEENGAAIAKGIDQFCNGVWSTQNLDAVVQKLEGKLKYNVRVVERVVEKPVAPSQTPQQQHDIFTEWKAKFCSRDIVSSPENDAAIK